MPKRQIILEHSQYMDTINFFEYIRNSSILGENALNEIEQILDEYPYFQSARLLHLKIQKNLMQGNALNKIEMNASNVYITDRKHMFRFLMQQQTVKALPQGGKKLDTEVIVAAPKAAKKDSFDAIIREVQQTIAEHKSEKEQVSQVKATKLPEPTVQNTVLEAAKEEKIVDAHVVETSTQELVNIVEVVTETDKIIEVQAEESKNENAEIEKVESKAPEESSDNNLHEHEIHINDNFNFEFAQNSTEVTITEPEQVVEFEIENNESETIIISEQSENIESKAELQVELSEEFEIENNDSETTITSEQTEYIEPKAELQVELSEEEKLAAERERRKEERRKAKEQREKEKQQPDEATLQRQKAIEESIKNLRSLSSKKNDSALNDNTVWELEVKQTENKPLDEVSETAPVAENTLEQITETAKEKSSKSKVQNIPVKNQSNKTENIVLGDKVIPDKEIEARTRIIEEARKTIEELNKKSREQQLSKENNSPEDIKDKLQKKVAEQIITLTETLSAKFGGSEMVTERSIEVDKAETIEVEKTDVAAEEIEFEITKPEDSFVADTTSELIADENNYNAPQVLVEDEIVQNTDEISTEPIVIIEPTENQANDEAQNVIQESAAPVVKEETTGKPEIENITAIAEVPGAAKESPADRVLRMIAEKKRLKELQAQEQLASGNQPDKKPEAEQKNAPIKPIEESSELNTSAEKAIKLLSGKQKQIKPPVDQTGTFEDELAARLMGWADTLKEKQYAQNELDKKAELEEENGKEDLGLLFEFDSEAETQAIIENLTIADAPEEILETPALTNVEPVEAPTTFTEQKNEEKAVLPEQSTSTKKPSKNRFDDLINKFIQEDPKTIRADASMFSTEDISVESASDNFEIVSESLAKVYVGQKLYDKAIIVYQKLILKNPEKSSYFATCISELEKLLNT